MKEIQQSLEIILKERNNDDMCYSSDSNDNMISLPMMKYRI